MIAALVAKKSGYMQAFGQGRFNLAEECRQLLQLRSSDRSEWIEEEQAALILRIKARGLQQNRAGMLSGHGMKLLR